MRENFADRFPSMTSGRQEPLAVAVGPLRDDISRGDNEANDDRANVAGAPSLEDSVSIRIGATLAEAERRIIVATLRRCGGNKTRAAAVLGVSLKTLYNRLNDYRLADCESSAEPSLDVSA